MKKIECIKDKYGSLIPVDKISYISQSHWVSIGGERKDIDHNTLELLRCIFKEIKMEDCIQEKTADKSGSTWSEEDMAIIDDAIFFIQEFQKSDRCKNESDMQNSVTCERFLIFLKDKVAPQSKQEWSEEDEEMLSDAIAAVHIADYYAYEVKENIERWLNSLKDRVQPQPKMVWSEEDESWFKEIELMCLNFSNDADYREKFFTWLNSLRSQNRWKPSDRELGAMLAAIGDERQKGSDVAKELQKIYQQLKKL